MEDAKWSMGGWFGNGSEYKYRLFYGGTWGVWGAVLGGGYPPVDIEGLLVGWWNYKVRKMSGGMGG